MTLGQQFKEALVVFFPSSLTQTKLMCTTDSGSASVGPATRIMMGVFIVVIYVKVYR